MDWGNVGNGIIIAFVIFLGSSILAMLRMVFMTYKEVMHLKGRSDRSRSENVIQFKAIKAIIRCLRNGEKNGNLTTAEREIDEYLHHSVH